MIFFLVRKYSVEAFIISVYAFHSPRSHFPVCLVFPGLKVSIARSHG